MGAALEFFCGAVGTACTWANFVVVPTAALATDGVVSMLVSVGCTSDVEVGAVVEAAVPFNTVATVVQRSQPTRESHSR